MIERRANWIRTLTSVLVVGAFFGSAAPGAAQEANVVRLTLERMVDLALSNSFQVRQLNMSIDRTRFNLQAERARLKSRIDLNVSAPDFQSIAEPRWNSTLQREEIIHENSRRFEAQLSIRQPVVLFGYPTNGYLSLNNRIYRYNQLDNDGVSDLRYYNRYFVSYTQPLFQPNGLRKDIEGAELDLEDSQLRFYRDVVELVADLSDDYFELFGISYQELINGSHVENLTAAVAAAETLSAADSTRTIEVGQIRVELANASEQVRQSESQFRLNAASLRTRLNLAETDSITLSPLISVRPVTTNTEQATQFAMELSPRIRQLNISLRENEIRLEETKGRRGFRMDLGFSYGREAQDPIFDQIWADPSNSYTIDVNAYLPIWDWGERSSRIEGSRIALDQSRLRREEAEQSIRSDMRNQVRNVGEFEDRALAMEQNLGLATGLSESSLELYEQGLISALDLLQSFRRQVDTANNFLDAYLGWRRALLRIQQLTFYDFELDLPLLERFGVMSSPETDS